jgi:hypothetical protein
MMVMASFMLFSLKQGLFAKIGVFGAKQSWLGIDTVSQVFGQSHEPHLKRIEQF